ncbi:hypothetical protein CDN98_21200 [Roseateles terrae]|nr:hypothetical protein CDN98_21200 [Roseateles terrae]
MGSAWAASGAAAASEAVEAAEAGGAEVAGVLEAEGEAGAGAGAATRPGEGAVCAGAAEAIKASDRQTRVFTGCMGCDVFGDLGVFGAGENIVGWMDEQASVRSAMDSPGRRTEDSAGSVPAMRRVHIELYPRVRGPTRRASA